ncbi:hypothetical protein Tco_0838626 [Tanacetum coccineum]|uniref:Uncharacterized protein n=1 Tax=Tanacetum coccineum TaxID=301880 RepID=A0ABQ5AT98_9ASTR
MLPLYFTYASANAPSGGVTSLSKKVESLESELKKTKQTYSTALIKLIKKVKKLEHTVKTSQARRRAKVVIFGAEEDEEDPSKQRRSLIKELDMDAGISLLRVSTGNGGVSTASELVSIAGVKEKNKGQSRFAKSLPPKKIKREFKSSIRNTEELLKKEYMSTYIKNQEGGYTLKQLKSLSFEEVKKIFEATMRKVQSFVLMDSELEVQRLKIECQDIVEEPAKRQRTREASGSVQEQTGEEPKAEELYRYLRYKGLQYTEDDIADFELRLARIYRREVHRVQVFDFGGLPDLMTEGLSARMLMEHLDAHGVSLFIRRAWRWLFDIRGPLITDKEDLRDYWIGISSAGDFLGIAPSYTAIQDTILRLCYRLITCSIARRSQAPEKVTVIDLFYLRGMDVDSINVPYLLGRYLRLFSARRKSGAHIFGGQFVARLAKHFGLLTTKTLQGLTVIALALMVINMAELVRLHICEHLDDTWAWVAIRPKTQPDAVAGAPGVA